jgi:hypothetical protein
MYSVGAVLFFEDAYLCADLLERNIITGFGVGLCEAVHDGPKGFLVVDVYVDEKEEMVDESKESVEK